MNIDILIAPTKGSSHLIALHRIELKLQINTSNIIQHFSNRDPWTLRILEGVPRGSMNDHD
jgi:hypothetical protein